MPGANAGRSCATANGSVLLHPAASAIAKTKSLEALSARWIAEILQDDAMAKPPDARCWSSDVIANADDIGETAIFEFYKVGIARRWPDRCR